MSPYNPTMPYQYPYPWQGVTPAPAWQPQQSQQPAVMQTQSRVFPPITGRTVNSLDEITVQEVPTDGTVAWFPSADGSCVYAKRWTPDGNITTMRFVPETAEPAPTQPDPFQIINDRMDELFGLVEEIRDDMPRSVETKRVQQTAKRRAVKTDAE